MTHAMVGGESVTRERPILMSAPMVCALLGGRKTQTRRIAKLNASGRVERGGRNWHCEDPAAIIASPYGSAGDHLWVRETFSLQHCVDGEPPPFDDGRPVLRATDDYMPDWYQPHYRATDPDPELCCESDDCRQCERNGAGPHWKPSIFMPRWASRITLEVTGVCIERLHAISEADAAREGVFCVRTFANDDRTPVELYRALWESINGAESLAANPWVWVVEFKAIKP